MPRKRRPFNKLWPLLAAALIPLVLLTARFVWMAKGMQDYKTFKSNLAVSVNDALTHDCMTASTDGVRTLLTADNAGSLYRTICNAGYQCRAKEKPKEAGVTVSFGNGDCLCVWKYSERGLVVYYANADGDYLFITDETVRYLSIVRIVSEAWGNRPLAPAAA